jgi:hypothetical protein
MTVVSTIKPTVAAITSDMTPREAMEAFLATLRGAEVREAEALSAPKLIE